MSPFTIDISVEELDALMAQSTLADEVQEAEAQKHVQALDWAMQASDQELDDDEFDWITQRIGDDKTLAGIIRKMTSALNGNGCNQEMANR